MGEGRQRCRKAAWDEEGGKFPDGIIMGWEEAVHVTCCVTYVTKEHFRRLIFVERTLAHLVVGIMWGRGVQNSCRGRRGRGYQRLG